jgi:sugar O-acyltransferase (sialic acid O-acetyltransferase NeuD family)
MNALDFSYSCEAFQKIGIHSIWPKPMDAPIVTVGSGRFAFQVGEIIRQTEKYSKAEHFSFCRHAPNDQSTPFPRIDVLPQAFDYIIAIGNPGYRQNEWKYIANARLDSKPISLISHKACIDQTATLAEDGGIIVLPHSVISSTVKLGPFSIVGVGSIIEHDCTIGSFCTIGPGAVICGSVYVETSSFIGANATVIQSLSIGKCSTIGAGSVIINDVDERSVVVGNPGRKIKQVINNKQPL